MQYTLVVVDMQVLYSEAQGQEVIQSVRSLIAQAKEDRASIVVLEHAPTGASEDSIKTIDAIKEEVGSYSQSCTLKKEGHGGGKEVLAACKEKGFPTSTFRICGCYANCCVKATCEDIAQILNNTAKIEVYRKACDNCDLFNFNWITLVKGMHLFMHPIHRPLMA
jgi:nicotinamidase-related amidase